MREKNDLLSYEVIVEASCGDILAMRTALQHYERYIMYYALKKIYDEYGSTSTRVDEDKVNRMRTKLMRAILCFEV